MDWNDALPIYRQLRERIVEQILEGVLPEGEALPSVRQIALELKINPITVGKAYQDLVDDGLIEKRRGLGMYVALGARNRLLERERERFLSEVWPELVRRMARLGLDATALLATLAANEGKP